MAHPKRRQSKAHTRKRRAHDALTAPQVAACPTTGQPHLFHRAHWHEGKLYYKGKVVMEKAEA